MTITLTDAAASHIKETIDSLSKQKNNQILGIKFGVKKTGCSGYSYTVDFIYQNQDIKNFELFNKSNINIYVEKNDLKFVEGMGVDYVQKGLGSVMVFNNPNAENECGCGESFSLKEKDK